jgi:hypothetical protein
MAVILSPGDELSYCMSVVFDGKSGMESGTALFL